MTFPSSARHELSLDQLDALTEELATFPPQSQRRGREYAMAGRVGAISWGESGFDASVVGRDVYESAWFWERGTWDCDCTCPAGPYCKHVYALASIVLGQTEAARTGTDGRLGRLVPSHRGDSAADQAPPPPAQRIPLIDKLRAASDYWTRYQYFLKLVQQAAARRVNAHPPELEEILREEDPDMMCWRLATALSYLPSEVYPPALGPYRERPDLQARFFDRERSALATALLDWAGGQRRAVDRKLRLVLGLDIGPGRQPRITAQARLTSSRMQDEPRTPAQLQQLRSELRRSPESFPPETAVLLEWAAERVSELAGIYTSGIGYGQHLSAAQLSSLLSRLPGSELVTWDPRVDPNLAQRGGIGPGQPMRASAEPVRILPNCRSVDGELVIELACVWANNRMRPLRDVIHFRGSVGHSAASPSYVLADGCFFAVTHEPPTDLLDRFNEVDTLAVPRDERDAVLGTLTASFHHLQRTVGDHTQYHTLQPLVAMDLRDDDWLQVRIYARLRSEWTPSDPVSSDDVVFEYTPAARWVRLTSRPSPAAIPEAFDDIPAAANASEAEQAPTQTTVPATQSIEAEEVWFETPNPDLVAPALGWMTAIDLRPGKKGRPGGRAPTWSDAHVGWWQRLSRRTAAVFAEVWEQRPPGVAFFGTSRVRRLLSGEARVWPTLKIESSGLDWFAVSAAWEAEGLRLSDEDLAALRQSTTRFVKISSGWVQRDVAEVHDAAADVLADLGIEAGGGTQRLTVWQLVGAKPESLAALEQFGVDAQTLAEVQRLKEQVRSFQGLPAIARPPGLVGELRPYQQLGLDFLTYTASIGVGAILADDMGLGKTLQALAWLLHLREQDPNGGPCLVVCPASVVHNWQREAERFAPSLRILLLTSGKTRHELRREIPEHDLVVTNYALLRRDVEAWREATLRAVIFDEAQQIKNPDAAVTRAAASVPAPHRVALTGTPMENRALDLFSIVDVINPGYLGRRSRFQLRFDKPDAPPHVRAMLATKLRPILLRRTKKEVAPELPERIEEQWDCEMTTGQRQLYLAEVKRSRAMIDNLADTQGGITQNKIHILAALTRLRQICCHPQLTGGKSEVGSGKFEAFFELLEPLLAEGHKVLVFSQFVACIRLLRTELSSRAIGHHVLTGQSTKRGAIIDAFQSDPNPCVFLISLKAGGTGLNLTAASYVVLFDPWWNPAVEAQAIDRTHRIGQDRTVIAYRLITRGTIEEKIFQLQQRKAALVRDVLGEDGFARTLTRTDLDYLLEEA